MEKENNDVSIVTGWHMFRGFPKRLEENARNIGGKETDRDVALLGDGRM